MPESSVTFPQAAAAAAKTAREQATRVYTGTVVGDTVVYFGLDVRPDGVQILSKELSAILAKLMPTVPDLATNSKMPTLGDSGDAYARGAITSKEDEQAFRQLLHGRGAGPSKDAYAYGAALLQTFYETVTDMGLTASGPDGTPRAISPEDAGAFEAELVRRMQADERIDSLMLNLGIRL
ncbi:MAG: hypothetical protein LBC79_04795 [Deltaproteobacteria bacterium]|nr:hypothetical protein [Deltaproteobacteria bacterium]